MARIVNRERVIDTFMELCSIESPSKKERSIADYLKNKFKGYYQVLEDDTGRKIGGETGNLYVYIPGTGEPILLSGHMDTVVPTAGVKPILGSDGIIRSAGDTILGADDKIALAAFLELVHLLTDIPEHRPVEIVMSVAEEIGLLGAYNFDTGRLKSKIGFVFDTSQPPGTAVNAAPGSEVLKAEIRGCASHAGIAPEKGINALQAAARGIAAMRLGRIDFETTANIGILESGLATNIVPEKAHFEGEIRSHNTEKLLAQKEHMNACIIKGAEDIEAEAEIEWEKAYSAFKIGEDALPVQTLKKADDVLGLEYGLFAGGGGSDANVFNEKGIECIVLGCGMKDVHSTKENVSVEDLLDVADLTATLIRNDI